jgi:iron complex transport system substrate-binding protein
MRRVAVALLLWLAAAAGAAAAPARIVSLNLCTDGLLLALVPAERIAALSRQSANPLMSPIVEAAGSLPRVNRTAEQVLAYAPDLVVAHRYSAGLTKAMLRRVGVPVHEVGVANSFEALYEELRSLGRVLGDEAAAERLSARIAADLAAVSRPVGADAKTALSFGPRGGTSGTGSLIDEVITKAGYRNLAAELGFGHWGTLPLEAVLRARPDVIVVEGHGDAKGGVGRDLVRHPALADIAAKRIVLPGPTTTCMGPATVEAVARLAAAR